MTTSRLRVVLGLVWLVDAGLQAQPAMFTAHLAHGVIDPAAAGQPALVSAPVAWVGSLLAAAPALNIVFVLVQAGIGLGLLWPRSTRPALIASALYGLLLWYLADGLGGMLSGQASLLTGLPSAPLLYAVASIALWPGPGGDEGLPGEGGVAGPARAGRLGRLDRGLARLGRHLGSGAWTVLWLVGALYRLLPAQRSPRSLARALAAQASAAPGVIAGTDRALAHGSTALGSDVVVALALAELAVGLGVLYRPSATGALILGGLLASAFWLFGQDLGRVYTGQATDVASGPLYVLLATIIAVRRRAGADPAPAGQGGPGREAASDDHRRRVPPGRRMAPGGAVASGGEGPLEPGARSGGSSWQGPWPPGPDGRRGHRAQPREGAAHRARQPG